MVFFLALPRIYDKEGRIFAACEFCEIVNYSYPLYNTSQLEETIVFYM